MGNTNRHLGMIYPYNMSGENELNLRFGNVI